MPMFAASIWAKVSPYDRTHTYLMALGPRLDLRQSQSLVMTPQLQQAIRLLALSNVELEAHISEAIESNPLLESGGDMGGEAAAGEPGEGREAPQSDQAQAADDMVRNGPDEGEATMASGDQAFADQLGAADGPTLPSTPTTSAAASAEAPDLENMLAEQLTLADHLTMQAGAALSGAQLLIAARLIDHIDETGYLRAELLPLAHDLGVELAEVEGVLTTIQGFDPAGVGARDLAECLAIQAREADRYDPAMAALIDNLDLLASGKLAQLKRVTQVDDEDLADMIAELRAYDPKPGSRFDSDGAQPVIPDLFVTRRGEKWTIEINSATLPRLLVDRHYHAELAQGAQDSASRKWLNECLADANWLVKALDQRQRTIVKVATEIVKQQQGFFEQGVAHLRPLTLRAVAEAVDLHESTVSRVTSNKYLSCSRGTYELKYFFTSGIAAADGGEAVSAEAVKARLKALIDGEDPKKILSDDKLVALLKGEGFDIARRTVAKYREAMGLGSSVQRRRQKALTGQAA